MQEIITTLKEKLAGKVKAIKSIEIIPHPEILPGGIKFPFVGIKDGLIQTDGTLDPLTTYVVDLFCYVEIKKVEASIIGTQNKIGVLELADQVEAALLELGNLEIAGISNYGKATQSPPSEPGWHGETYIQRKQVGFWYRKNE